VNNVVITEVESHRHPRPWRQRADAHDNGPGKSTPVVVKNGRRFGLLVAAAAGCRTRWRSTSGEGMRPMRCSRK